jgi:prepilin-type N-terminal cleavage/methylation domain-containing protein
MHKKDSIMMLTSGCVQLVVFRSARGKASASEGEINKRGVTLIELTVVLSIIGVLVVAMGYSYADWMGKYKVEKVTKELYADLMDARYMAMTRNCDHFVDFNFPAPPAGYGTYRIAEDTDEDTEGDDDADGVIDAAGHTFLPSFPKTVEYPITNNFAGKIINFDKRGIVQPRGQAAGGTICFFTNDNPDYDCIVISQTRIIVGKLKKQPDSGGECNTDNCAKK